MENSLKERLFGLLEEEPSDEIVSGEIRELIEKIFDEDGNKINWDVFLKEHKLLMLNERQFDSAVRAIIVSVLRKGGILSLEEPEEDGNYEVLIFSSSGLGKENAFYNSLGQGIHFINKDDALNFADAFNEAEREEAEVYFTQKVIR